MKLLLDTSTPICYVTIVDDEGVWRASQWEANRELARDLLAYLRDKLAEQSLTFADIRGIGVYEGPGSFTGLRIGITVANTLASSLGVPIVGTTGDKWREDAVRQLDEGDDQRLVMPAYGGEANITTPRK